MNQRISRLFVFVVVSLLLCLLGSQIVAAQGVSFNQVASASLPWDAVPSPDGSIIYFTAVGDDGLPGVFSVPGTGGEVSKLTEGKPFVLPLGIAISTDGQTLYITDPLAAGSDGNAIFAMPASGGTQAIVVPGTQFTMPQGVEVVSRDGVDQLYFSGIDPNDGQPAIYTIAASGGEATILAKGSPLSAPSGITIAKNGMVYVLDRLASGNGLGSVLGIQGNTVEVIAGDVRTGGQIAGLTLTLDESLLLVSSLDGAQGTAQVLVIDLATKQTSIVNDVIGENTAAGGLHRAHNVNLFAWADSGGGRLGGTFCVRF